MQVRAVFLSPQEPCQELPSQVDVPTFRDLDAYPERIISYFVGRWQVEASFQEVPQRLGFETQRHWSEKAIERTAAAMLALFSLLTFFAHQYMAESANIARRTAWYGKRPHILRCSGADEDEVVGTRSDFL